jgi:hypothetical protein
MRREALGAELNENTAGILHKGTVNGDRTSTIIKEFTQDQSNF